MTPFITRQSLKHRINFGHHPIGFLRLQHFHIGYGVAAETFEFGGLAIQKLFVVIDTLLQRRLRVGRERDGCGAAAS